MQKIVHLAEPLKKMAAAYAVSASSALSLIAIMMTVTAMTGCGDGGKPTTPKDAMPPTEVDVISINADSAIVTQELQGRVSAIRSAQIRARVEGVLEKQLVRDGSDVSAGTPLFRIDSRMYQANLMAAEADYAAQRATLDRYEPLLANKAVSVQEYDAAKARVKSAEATWQRAKLDMENAMPAAPISGRVGRALVTEGALVGKGEATHLATIEQLDPIRVEFTQPYSDVLALKRQLKDGKRKALAQSTIEIVLEDGNVYAQRGQLKFNDLAVDPNTGTIALRAEFPNPQHELLPGTFVRVRMPQATVEKAIRVPQRAVTTGSDGQTVLVVGEEGKVALRPIITDGIAGSDFLVARGLKDGEQVIVNGVQKIRPGSTVKPVPWEPKPLLPTSVSANSQ